MKTHNQPSAYKVVEKPIRTESEVRQRLRDLDDFLLEQYKKGYINDSCLIVVSEARLQLLQSLACYPEKNVL
jgi:tRNA A37 threonylcarbamoyladenosine synthetase subunit TsaC/SUA5/YrdC